MMWKKEVFQKGRVTYIKSRVCLKAIKDYSNILLIEIHDHYVKVSFRTYRATSQNAIQMSDILKVLHGDLQIIK